MSRSKMKLLATLALGLGLVAGSAQAASPRLYVGAGLGDSTLDVGSADKSLGTVSAKLGMQFGRFFGLEADIGAASDDSDSILSESVYSYQALFARVGFTVDRAMFYALVGQARTEFDRDTLFGDGSGGATNETVNVYGGGVNLFGNETTAINLEFRYFENGDLTTAHLGVQHFFGGFR